MIIDTDKCRDVTRLFWCIVAAGVLVVLLLAGGLWMNYQAGLRELEAMPGISERMGE